MKRELKRLKERYIRLTPEKRIYQSSVPVVGVTGGVASGKSTVVGLLRQRGFPVIEGDLLVKEMYQEKETLFFIGEHFPHTIGDAGQILFPRLRQEFFSVPESKQHIEEYLKPKFSLFFNRALQSLRPLPSNFVFYEYPVIFEQSLSLFFDVIIGVLTSREQQLQRVIERDLCSVAVAERILDQQISQEQLAGLCELLIDNKGDLFELKAQLKRVLVRLLEN